MGERDTFLNDIMGIPDGIGLESDRVLLPITLWCNAPALHIIENGQGAIITHVLPHAYYECAALDTIFHSLCPNRTSGKDAHVGKLYDDIAGGYVGDFTDM